jgi:hypothetical protein
VVLEIPLSSAREVFNCLTGHMSKPPKTESGPFGVKLGVMKGLDSLILRLKNGPVSMRSYGDMRK